MASLPGVFNDGWNWPSIPGNPVDPEASSIIGPLAENNLIKWDRVVKTFLLYPFDFRAMEVGEGYSLWARAGTGDVDLALEGAEPQLTQEIHLPTAGWTWIGTPCNHDVLMSNLRIREAHGPDLIANPLDTLTDLSWSACVAELNDGTPVDGRTDFVWLKSLGFWYYCWYRPDPGATGWDLTSAVIEYDYLLDADNTGGRILPPMNMQFRIYSGVYDSGSQAWTLTGYETFTSSTPVPMEDKWIHERFIPGTGERENYGAGTYDPTHIYYVRFWGLGGEAKPDDKFGIDNLVIYSRPTRTPEEDASSPKPLLNWNFLWWDSVNDTAKIASPQGGADDDMLRPWRGYRLYANLGSEGSDLLVPKP
jgi:hypothetical protein